MLAPWLIISAALAVVLLFLCFALVQFVRREMRSLRGEVASGFSMVSAALHALARAPYQLPQTGRADLVSA